MPKKIKKVKKVKKTKKVSRKKKATKKKTGGGKSTMHFKATTWGLAREKFKRGLGVSRDKVFVTAKKCKTHDNCYVVKYTKRTKKTTRPKGSPTSAMKRYWGD